TCPRAHKRLAAGSRSPRYAGWSLLMRASAESHTQRLSAQRFWHSSAGGEYTALPTPRASLLGDCRSRRGGRRGWACMASSGAECSQVGTIAPEAIRPHLHTDQVCRTLTRLAADLA